MARAHVLHPALDFQQPGLFHLGGIFIRLRVEALNQGVGESGTFLVGKLEGVQRNLFESRFHAVEVRLRRREGQAALSQSTAS